MSSDPFKYDLGAHILNEYTKGLYMKPKPEVKIREIKSTKKTGKGSKETK